MKIKDKKPVTKKEISIKFKCSACGNDTPCFFIIAAWDKRDWSMPEDCPISHFVTASWKEMEKNDE